jgi:hypothetical protein
MCAQESSQLLSTAQQEYGQYVKGHTFMRARRGVSGCCDVSMTASAPSLFSASALLLPRQTATTLAPMALLICTAIEGFTYPHPVKLLDIPPFRLNACPFD